MSVAIGITVSAVIRYHDSGIRWIVWKTMIDISAMIIPEWITIPREMSPKYFIAFFTILRLDANATPRIVIITTSVKKCKHKIYKFVKSEAYYGKPPAMVLVCRVHEC